MFCGFIHTVILAFKRSWFPPWKPNYKAKKFQYAHHVVVLLTVPDFVFVDVAGGMTHWEVGKAEPVDPSLPVWQRYHHAGASNIEMSAIALLVYTANKDKLGGIPIIKWLASQQGPNGGFSSTQVRGHNKYLVGRCSKISVFILN